MMKIMEKTVFLRSLNYLRVTHQYAIRYNLIYPLLFGCALSTVVLLLASAESLFEKDGLLTSFTPVLSILAPFYIAALAAVSTFSGTNSIDEPFKMSQPVLLKVIGEGGDWENIDVSPRHFLSLLFGYCTALSMFLLTVSIFSPLVLKGVKAVSTTNSEWLLGFILLFFVILLSQLILCTLLGVYFLADRIHRD